MLPGWMEWDGVCIYDADLMWSNLQIEPFGKLMRSKPNFQNKTRSGIDKYVLKFRLNDLNIINTRDSIQVCLQQVIRHHRVHVSV